MEARECALVAELDGDSDGNIYVERVLRVRYHWSDPLDMRLYRVRVLRVRFHRGDPLDKHAPSIPIGEWMAPMEPEDERANGRLLCETNNFTCIFRDPESDTDDICSDDRGSRIRFYKGYPRDGSTRLTPLTVWLPRMRQCDQRRLARALNADLHENP